MKPVIIGAGLAGLAVALALAPRPVILLVGRKLGDGTSSGWAQGGIAAALGADDTPSLHAEDTVKAGGGLCDAAIVKQVTEDAPAVISWLEGQGVVFDRDNWGHLRLGLEGAHSRRRIVHANGDGTGAGVMQALIRKARLTPSINIIEDAIATRLLVGDGIEGVEVRRDGVCEIIPTPCAVLATGGAGSLWQETTNPPGSWGCGFALAARAGAALADLEFMQFHPTAIAVGRDPMPLASEALRGEGAILIDENGTRFMADYARKELEPRDVVARAIWNHLAKGHRVFLDVRALKNFAERFPQVYGICKSAGLDPARAPIPVRPAAHYHMGGVLTDANGRSTVKGLWACGEVACTGLNGANRLASNSLLEAASMGRRVAKDIRDQESEVRGQRSEAGRSRPNFQAHTKEVRKIMSVHVGVLRERKGLEAAIRQLTPLVAQSDMALAGLLIATAALRRSESRGAQARTDYPETSPAWQHRQIFKLEDVLAARETGHAA